jgi:hypothetical protein
MAAWPEVTAGFAKSKKTLRTLLRCHFEQGLPKNLPGCTGGFCRLMTGSIQNLTPPCTVLAMFLIAACAGIPSAGGLKYA